jgi:hypothetical protein
VTTIVSVHGEGGDGGVRLSTLVLSPLVLSGETANVDITIPMIINITKMEIGLFFIFQVFDIIQFNLQLRQLYQ